MSIELILAWITITSIGICLPGPDFIYISSCSIYQRKYGFWAYFGIQTGVIWNSFLGIVGVMFLNIANFLSYIQIIGGLYIAYIGWKVIRSHVKYMFAKLKSQKAASAAVSASASATQEAAPNVSMSADGSVDSSSTTASPAASSSTSQTLAQAESSSENEFSTDNLKRGIKFKDFSFKTIYTRGLLVNMSNPKCAIFMIAVLPQFVNRNSEMSVFDQLMVLCIINFFEGIFLWTCLVFFVNKISQMFKSDKFREVLDIVLGGILILLGCILFASTWIK